MCTVWNVLKNSNNKSRKAFLCFDLSSFFPTRYTWLLIKYEQSVWRALSCERNTKKQEARSWPTERREQTRKGQFWQIATFFSTRTFLSPQLIGNPKGNGFLSNYANFSPLILAFNDDQEEKCRSLTKVCEGQTTQIHS